MADQPLALDRQPTQVEAAETPGLTGLLTLAVAVVVVTGLYLGRTVLLPVTLAVLLSFVLAPLVNLLRRLWLGRVLSVLLSVLFALSVILALGGLIGTQIAGLAQDVPRYVSTIETKLDAVRGATVDRFNDLTSRLDRQMRQARGAVSPAPAPAAAEPAPTSETPAPRPIPVEVHQPQPSAVEIAERIITPVVEPLSTTAIVLIVTIFVLLQREDLRDRLIRLFGSSDLHRTTVAMNDAARRLSRYFLAQLALNASFGVVIGLGLFIIGVPSPVLWGVVGMLLRFVPYIGAPLSALGPLALAAAVDPGWTMLFWTALLFVMVDLVVGQAVEPLLYGHSAGLSPFAVVVAATFWTWLWGPIGLILSTPLTLCLVVLGRHVERLEFLDVILGDRPALTPVESFYQRILAGDPDEAEDQAEQLLKDLPLSTYYDEVAVRGLRLAANDAARGVLTAAQLERIQASIIDLIEGLDEYTDAPPATNGRSNGSAGPTRAEQAMLRTPPLESVDPASASLSPGWQGEAPVLCIAGRGPLDEAAASMLAQLLRKHGLGARVLPHGATARATVGALNPAGVAMVCICYLDLSGSPSNLRYVVRRLRRRMPEARMLVGLWPAEAHEDEDRLRAAINADDYVSSLRDAVETCLEAAFGGLAQDRAAQVAPAPPAPRPLPA